jgi:hypothetical protein
MQSCYFQKIGSQHSCVNPLSPCNIRVRPSWQLDWRTKYHMWTIFCHFSGFLPWSSLHFVLSKTNIWILKIYFCQNKNNARIYWWMFKPNTRAETAWVM